MADPQRASFFLIAMKGSSTMPFIANGFIAIPVMQLFLVSNIRQYALYLTECDVCMDKVEPQAHLVIAVKSSLGKSRDYLKIVRDGAIKQKATHTEVGRQHERTGATLLAAATLYNYIYRVTVLDLTLSGNDPHERSARRPRPRQVLSPTPDTGAERVTNVSRIDRRDSRKRSLTRSGVDKPANFDIFYVAH
ncbi:hypothetical protein EVAR_72776_1 [Eumeta japonica]|uniref:Uncharacterized protein n=1 Tax=Eumeta variegata TaxID=151549 RepID=A0A4C2AGN0_EUMVA|nr:hypothetical protein EVAR_72776_1 [Eumeta japonica]